MITMHTLKEVYHKIFFNGDPTKEKYLVPLTGSWEIPLVKSDEETADWIGFSIVSKRPRTRMIRRGAFMTKNVRVNLRLVFFGPNAETFANETMFWDERTDVSEEFGKLQAQIMYDSHLLTARVVNKETGVSNQISWIVDFSCMCFYEVDTKQKPWFYKEET